MSGNPGIPTLIWYPKIEILHFFLAIMRSGGPEKHFCEVSQSYSTRNYDYRLFKRNHRYEFWHVFCWIFCALNVQFSGPIFSEMVEGLCYRWLMQNRTSQHHPKCQSWFVSKIILQNSWWKLFQIIFPSTEYEVVAPEFLICCREGVVAHKPPKKIIENYGGSLSYDFWKYRTFWNFENHYFQNYSTNGIRSCSTWISPMLWK